MKYAFKTLSQNRDELEKWLETLKPVDIKHFTQRHNPVLPIEPILPEDTYFLGYIIEKELRDCLSKNPEDKEAKRKDKRRKEIIIKGTRNYEAYLSSDHLDVYVATSMRQHHEYVMVNKLAKKIFGSRCLKSLKLRWFDPTQAYCQDRIDKGLAEALMLKRAKCTIYLVQEADTLGKDSELASTLAQGKPVIAFIPEGDAEYVRELLDELKKINHNKTDSQIILEQFRFFDNSLAWDDQKIRKWLQHPENINYNEIRKELERLVQKQYNKRAELLSEDHPLGIQVNLSTGVANGVLVVRKIDDCARLLRSILTRTMKFNLEKYKNGTNEYIVLREEISNCIFRVVTGHAMLTNTFWNYYLESPD